MDIDLGELGPLQPVNVTFIFILSYHESMSIFSLSFSAKICLCPLCAAHKFYLCYKNVTLCEERKTNKMQQLDVYYRLLS